MPVAAMPTTVFVSQPSVERDARMRLESIGRVGGERDVGPLRGDAGIGVVPHAAANPFDELADPAAECRPHADAVAGQLRAERSRPGGEFDGFIARRPTMNDRGRPEKINACRPLVTRSIAIDARGPREVERVFLTVLAANAEQRSLPAFRSDDACP